MSDIETFGDYVAAINKLAQERPELLSKKVVYAADDEGNNFQALYHDPTPGYFYHGDFTSEAAVKECPEEWDYDSFDDFETNAVCVN